MGTRVAEGPFPFPGFPYLAGLGLSARREQQGAERDRATEEGRPTGCGPKAAAEPLFSCSGGRGEASPALPHGKPCCCF